MGPRRRRLGATSSRKVGCMLLTAWCLRGPNFGSWREAKIPIGGKKSGPHGPLWFALAVLYQFSNFVGDLCGDNLVAIGFATHQRLGELGRLIQRDFGRHR